MEAHSFEVAQAALISCIQAEPVEVGENLVARISAAPPHEVAPIVMLGAFSLELYLKCLHRITTGKEKWGHDNKLHFDSLDEPVRLRVAARHAELLRENADALAFIVKELASRGEPPPDFSMETALSRYRLAFKSWRYLFEEPEGPRPYVPMFVRDAVKAVILEHRPEWEG